MPVYDPLTTTPAGSGYVRAAFPGNQIPANRIDPVAKALMAYYPQPTGSGNQFTNVNNYFAPGVQTVQIDQGDIKLDQYIDSDNRFSVRVSAV